MENKLHQTIKDILSDNHDPLQNNAFFAFADFLLEQGDIPVEEAITRLRLWIAAYTLKKEQVLASIRRHNPAHVSEIKQYLGYSYQEVQMILDLLKKREKLKVVLG